MIDTSFYIFQHQTYTDMYVHRAYILIIWRRTCKNLGIVEIYVNGDDQVWWHWSVKDLGLQVLPNKLIVDLWRVAEFWSSCIQNPLLYSAQQPPWLDSLKEIKEMLSAFAFLLIDQRTIYSIWVQSCSRKLITILYPTFHSP
jgi:hypothetical protein